jgi:hypothetical protein
LLASEFWKSLKVLTVFEQWLSRVEAVAIASLLSVAAALHCSQVFSRYVFSKSFSSIDEISIYMVIAMVFLGTSSPTHPLGAFGRQEEEKEKRRLSIRVRVNPVYI